jgi:hypothetical protein
LGRADFERAGLDRYSGVEIRMNFHAKRATVIPL